MNWMMGLGHWRDRKASYIRLAKKFWISEEIVFPGSTDEPEKYNGAADLLVHPSFYDACSLVVLEALASGLPVITTRYNGAGGIITDGKDGLVLDDPRDVRGLAEKILVLSDPIQLKETSLAARTLAQKYSQQRRYEDMLNVLQELRR